MISADLPARKAAGTSVMDCIRQTDEIKIEAKDVKTGGLTRRLCGLEGLLTLKRFRRNKKRYRSVVLSLTLSVVLFVAGGDISFHTVINTISTNIRPRRRELTMLRSMGMSDRSFIKMMNTECVFYGMRTLLFGVPIAVVLSWLIYKGMVAVDGSIEHAVPGLKSYACDSGR